MHCLTVAFKLLTLCGFWRPLDWKPSTGKYWLYNIFTCIMLAFILSFGTLEFIYAIVADNIADSIEILSFWITVAGVLGKVATFLIRRGKIIALANMLLEDQCLPHNEEEVDIKNKYDEIARFNTIIFEILNESVVLFFAILPFAVGVQHRILPAKALVPFDIQPLSNFLLAYYHQIISLACCANASVANEAIISGLMILTCGQFEILNYRVINIPMTLLQARKTQKVETRQESIKLERKLIVEVIHHHLFIIRFAEQLNEIFSPVIFGQCIVSFFIFCTGTYRMSQQDFGAELAAILCYVLNMLLQLFLYTWYGNEVTLQNPKLSETIYKMDWSVLDPVTTKDLIIIMMRSSKPIVLTSCYVITLSNEIFTSLLKISYSAYNMLSQTSQTED